MTMNAIQRILALSVLLIGSGIAQAAPPVSASRHAHSLSVLHPATPTPTFLDLGAPGDSVGDQRLWHFNGVTPAGAPVVMEWIMTTTRIGNTANGEGIESRVTLGVFSFSGEDGDQVLLQGVGLYPASDSTFKPDSSLVRAIIGGTGKFRGASGDVLSTHLADGTWRHEFRFTAPLPLKRR